MRRRVGLLGAALVAGTLLVGCEPLDPMARRQQKVVAYQPSRFFSDGLAMRPPPPGAVHTQAELAPEMATGQGHDGRPLERIPVPVTAELLETGQKRFDILCATCHGLVGDGQSPVAINMALRRPPSLQDPTYRRRPDGYLYRVITEGFGLMPSYANQLPVRERWAVVAYLRALQLSQHQRLAAAPAPVRARLEKEPQP